MKKTLILGLVILALIFTNCGKVDKAGHYQQEFQSAIVLSKTINSGNVTISFHMQMKQAMDKLIKKLEKRFIDDKIAKGEISAMAALPVIPPEDLAAVITDYDVTEFTNDLGAAAYHYLVQNFEINVTSYNASSACIVNAAVLGNYLDQAISDSVGFETNTTTEFTYYLPPGISPTNPIASVLWDCLKSACGSIGLDLAKAGTSTAIAAHLSKQSIKQLLIGALGAEVTSAIAPIVLSWLAWETMWCTAAHYLEAE